jgi:hypothetical protein
MTGYCLWEEEIKQSQATEIGILYYKIIVVFWLVIIPMIAGALILYVCWW